MTPSRQRSRPGCVPPARPHPVARVQRRSDSTEGLGSFGIAASSRRSLGQTIRGVHTTPVSDSRTSFGDCQWQVIPWGPGTVAD